MFKMLQQRLAMWLYNTKFIQSMIREELEGDGHGNAK
tara:strand:- start:380 stop:490 length:111 start_codon:yes stop_codon:yes gene_type:complete